MSKIKVTLQSALFMILLTLAVICNHILSMKTRLHNIYRTTEGANVISSILERVSKDLFLG